MWKYVPTLATSALALLQLAKDWAAHQNTWRRAGVMFLIMFLGLGGAINTYYSEKKAVAQHAEDQKQIASLQKAVDTANAAQESNTKQFVASFANLSQQLGNLQSQVKTANLQKEAARLRAALESTQKSLNPHRAELESSLGDITETFQNLEVKEVPVQQQTDGTVSFTVEVVNKSDAEAKNGSIYLRICEKCEYSEEPRRFNRVVGADSAGREMQFQAIHPTTAIAIPLRIKPPELSRRFEIDVWVRCETCTVRPKDVLYVRF